MLAVAVPNAGVIPGPDSQTFTVTGPVGTGMFADTVPVPSTLLLNSPDFFLKL